MRIKDIVWKKRPALVACLLSINKKRVWVCDIDILFGVDNEFRAKVFILSFGLKVLSNHLVPVFVKGLRQETRMELPFFILLDWGHFFYWILSFRKQLWDMLNPDERLMWALSHHNCYVLKKRPFVFILLQSLPVLYVGDLVSIYHGRTLLANGWN